MSEPYIGIDFGTSNSAMAWYNPATRRAEILLNAEGEPSTPSVVYFGPDEVIVGKVAAQFLEDEDESPRVVASVKRNLVQQPVISLPDRPVRALDVAAAILGKLKHDAEEYTFKRQPVERAVITYPASFDALQKQEIERAARLAGFRQVEMIEEPIAAALGYAEGALGVEMGSRVLVYDLGGGTFDVAVLARQPDGSFDLALEPEGLEHCGGDDFDLALYNYCESQALAQVQGRISRNGLINRTFLALCRERKEQLSTAGKLTVSSLVHVNGSTQPFKQTIDRETLESLIENRITATVSLTDKVVAGAEEMGEPVDTIVLVGGSSRIPMVKRLLGEHLPEHLAGRIQRWQFQDAAVALGAAYRAHQLWEPPEVQIEPIDDSIGEEGQEAERGDRSEIKDALTKPPEGAFAPRQDGPQFQLEHAFIAAPAATTLTISQAVGAFAIDPEARLLAITRGFNVTVWELATGTLLYTIATPSMVGYTCGALAFSPDGAYLAAGDLLSVGLYDAATGDRLTPLRWAPRLGDFRRTLTVKGLCFRTKDDLFVGQVTGRLQRWNLVARRSSEFAPGTVPAPLESLVISPDGTLLAGVGNGEIAVWDVATGTRRHVMRGYGGHGLAFSPDGRTLATEGKFTRLDGKEARVEPTVMLWDTGSGEARKRVQAQPGGIECLAFSRDGRYLLTGTADAAFRLWDNETAEFVQALPLQEGRPLFAAFLPRERRLLTVTELPEPDRPEEDSMVTMVTGLVKQVRTVLDLQVSLWSYSD